MDKFEEFVNWNRQYIEETTRTYIGYGRGFLIAYHNEDHTSSLCQINLLRMDAEYTPIDKDSSFALEEIINIIKVTKVNTLISKGIVFKER